MSETIALETTAVDEPACRDLHLSVGEIVVWRFGISFTKALKSLGRDDGVHKEATSVAQDLRVGELLLADADDLVTYITGSRRRRTSLHALTEVSIVELQMGVLGEAKEDVRDDVVSRLGLLEEAMAIAVVALLDSEVTHLTRTTMHRVHLADDLADLSTIGPDILHSGSTDFAWDKGEVLDAVELGFGHLGYEVVPLDA